MSVTSAASNKSFFKSFSSLSFKDQYVAGGQNSEIILISINHTGTRLVNSRTDRSLRIWKCTPERLVDSIVVENPHTKAVESVSWNPRTEYSFASVGRDKFVKVWKGINGQMEREIEVTKKDDSAVQNQIVSYSADGEILAVVDRDSTITFLGVTQNYTVVEQIKLDEHIYDFSWFHDKHSHFICALHNGSVPLYAVYDGKVALRKTFTGHRSSATCLAVDPRGSYFAVGSNEGVISIWSTKSLLNTKVISVVDEAISHMSMSRDGAYIAVSYDNNSNIRIFDSETTEEVFEVPSSESGSLAFATVYWFPNKTSFAYTTDKGRTMAVMKKPEKS